MLELALEQEQAPPCEKLIGLAHGSSIRLIIPAYSFIEPHETLARRRLEREAFRTDLSKRLTQYARGASMAEPVATVRDYMKVFFEIAQHDAPRLESVKRRLLSIAEVLPMGLSVIQCAADFQSTFGLSPQDAIVYASVRARLELDQGSASADTSCFVSKDRDFDDQGIHADLASFNCKYFSSFVFAFQYIEHMIASTPDS